MLTKAAIQRLRSLRDKKRRDSLGLFVVEGEKPVGELLAAGFRFEEIYATEGWRGAVAERVSESEMARISAFPTPSSALAVGRIRREILAPGALDSGFTLALDGVQDPGNVGTILRIADWFALDRVVLSPDCADIFSPKVIQASMGSFARVAAYVTDLAAALKAADVAVLGCDIEGASVHAAKAPRDLVIVIGNEGRGLSAAVRESVTRFVTIPRRGHAESLNAAVAAGIVCALFRK
jgi:TrmH family RNA methyltransferase